MVNDRGGALVEQPVGSTNREREAPGMSAGGGYTVTGGIQVLPHLAVCPLAGFLAPPSPAASSVKWDNTGSRRMSVHKGGRRPDPHDWERHLCLRDLDGDPWLNVKMAVKKTCTCKQWFAV